MKYCEKCGNKLKDGYLFCDKCGTKIKEIKEVKEEKKKEKEIVKKNPTPVNPVPIFIPKKNKTGKGKIIFLSIMNILLLAATITFLILWLVKPSNKKCDVEKEKEVPIKEENKFIGIWTQNIEYKSKNKVVQSIYESIEIKENNTFSMVSYDKDNVRDTKEVINGSYTINGNKIELKWSEYGQEEKKLLEIDNDKLCTNIECSNYLLKGNNNNKITIEVDDDIIEEIEMISFSEYNALLGSSEDALVVVVREGCSWCELFRSVVEELASNYDTPIYYYEIDDNIDIANTPTTIVIKNGSIVDLIEGYKDYNTMNTILDYLEIK